ncbi:unnamed protein product, partial [Rotaria sp. Silwood1]
MASNNERQTMLTPKSAITYSKEYFKSLIHLRMELKISYCLENNGGALRVQGIDQDLTVYLKDDQHKNL